MAFVKIIGIKILKSEIASPQQMVIRKEKIIEKESKIYIGKHMKKSTPFVVCRDKFGREYQVLKEQLQLRIAVCGILKKNDSVLLITDPTTKKLELPGGATEKGETLEEALLREFYEETGVRIKIKRLLTYQESFYYMKNPDIPFQAVRLFFSVIPIDSAIRVVNGSFVNIDKLTRNNTTELTYLALRQLYPKR